MKYALFRNSKQSKTKRRAEVDAKREQDWTDRLATPTVDRRSAELIDALAKAANLRGTVGR